METKAESATYGYARVSSRDQNLNRQIDALTTFGIGPKQIYSDKASGKDFNRPAYKRLMRKLRQGDVLVIKSIDRLGRDYNEILREWRRITKEKQVAIVVLDMPLLDTRDVKGGITGVFLADVVLQLLSYVAQVEREGIKQRQAEGIAAAKARGVRFGRPQLQKPGNWEETRRLFLQDALSRREAAARLGVSPATFAKWMKEEGETGSIHSIAS